MKFIDYTSPLINGRRDGGVNPSQNSTIRNQAQGDKRPGGGWDWLKQYGWVDREKFQEIIQNDIEIAKQGTKE